MVESRKMVQVKPNKWIEVKRYKRVRTQSRNQNKIQRYRNIVKRYQELVKNVPRFQNQTYRSTEQDAGEQNKNVSLTVPPKNLRNLNQDNTSVDNESCQKSNVIAVALGNGKSQFKRKVQSRKSSNSRETTKSKARVLDKQGKLQTMENNWQNSPQANKIQQNEKGSEVPRFAHNINSLTQHEHLNTNVHKREVETAAYVESNGILSSAETIKLHCNHHENQPPPDDDHCLWSGPTNPLKSSPPIIGGESRGEIIYSREGTNGWGNGGLFTPARYDTPPRVVI